MNSHARALLLGVGLFVAHAASVATAMPAGLEPLSDHSADTVVSRAYVPSAERKVGEVRTLRRGTATVVQTLLYSRILKRVVAEIRLKEDANWPPEHPLRAEAQRFLDALDAARVAARRAVPKESSDRRQRVWIEFVRTPERAVVFVGTFTATRGTGDVEIATRTVTATLPLSRTYVERNMRLIVADAQGVAEADVAAIDPALASTP